MRRPKSINDGWNGDLEGGDHGPGDGEVREDDLKALMQLLPRSQMTEAPLWKQTSTSSSTKARKAALQEDPSNLELIFQLGYSYAKDLQWTQSFNVLFRGIGRLREIQNSDSRQLFARSCAEAALNCSRLDEALSVLTEAGEPQDDANELRHFCIMLCRVHCLRKDRLPAMKAFHCAISGATFDEALGALATLQEELRKAGFFEAARTAVQNMAESQDDRLKMRALESLKSVTLAGIQEANDEAEREDTARNGPRALRPLLRRWQRSKVSLTVLWADLRRFGPLQASKMFVRSLEWEDIPMSFMAMLMCLVIFASALLTLLLGFNTS